MSETILNLLRFYLNIRDVGYVESGKSLIMDFDDPLYNAALTLEKAVKDLYKEKKLSKDDVRLINSFIKNGSYVKVAEEMGLHRVTVSKRLKTISDIIADRVGEDLI